MCPDARAAAAAGVVLVGRPDHVVIESSGRETRAMELVKYRYLICDTVFDALDTPKWEDDGRASEWEEYGGLLRSASGEAALLLWEDPSS